MSDDIERKEFEKWFLNTDYADGVKDPLSLEPNGEYSWAWPQGMWLTWQARAALGQQKQEPVGYGVFWKEKGQQCSYFSVNLDDAILFSGEFSDSLKFARAIEAALKELP